MSTATEAVTDGNMAPSTYGPSYDQVLHALARRIYLGFCEHKNWTPYPFPYVDNASIRGARIAIDMLGYDDQVDLND